MQGSDELQREGENDSWHYSGVRQVNNYNSGVYMKFFLIYFLVMTVESVPVPSWVKLWPNQRMVST